MQSPIGNVCYLLRWPCHIWMAVFHDTSLHPLDFKVFLFPLHDVLLPLEILINTSHLELNAQQSFLEPWWGIISTLNFSISERVLLFPRMRMTLFWGININIEWSLITCLLRKQWWYDSALLFLRNFVNILFSSECFRPLLFLFLYVDWLVIKIV